LSPHGVHLYNDSVGAETVVGRLVPRTILPKAKCGALRGGTDCSYGLHHNCNVALRRQTPHNATEQQAQIQGAAIFRCPLFTALLFHALCGAQRSSASLPTDGAERALDFSRTMRYNSGTRTPRSRYHIIGKTGKKPTKYKEITRNTTFVKFHRTVAYKLFKSPHSIKDPHQKVWIFYGGVRGICLHFCRWQKLRLRSVKPSRATVHRTVAYKLFKSPPQHKRSTPKGVDLLWRSERDLNFGEFQLPLTKVICLLQNTAETRTFSSHF